MTFPSSYLLRKAASSPALKITSDGSSLEQTLVQSGITRNSSSSAHLDSDTPNECLRHRNFPFSSGAAAAVRGRPLTQYTIFTLTPCSGGVPHTPHGFWWTLSLSLYFDSSLLEPELPLTESSWRALALTRSMGTCKRPSVFFRVLLLRFGIVWRLLGKLENYQPLRC